MTEGLRSAPPTGPGFSGAAAAPQDAVAADVADTAKQAGARSLLPRPGWPFQWCSERVRIRSIASAIRVTQHRFSGSGPWRHRARVVSAFVTLTTMGYGGWCTGQPGPEALAEAVLDRLLLIAVAKIVTA